MLGCKYMGKRKKLLFLGDAVSAHTGLARIKCDLARGVHTHLGDKYEVASVGYGGPGSSKIPWPEYHLHSIDNWLVPELPQIAADFAGDAELTLMCVWDMSRLYWLGRPETCPNQALRRWVETAKVKKWAYAAIDAEGPNGKLPGVIADTYKGFDRVIEYSAFASRITGYPDHLPHGINTSVFTPHPKQEARMEFMKAGFRDLRMDSLLIGVVATNQQRKNWALAFQTAQILLNRGHDVRMWCHVDQADRYWSIGNLVADYGLGGRVALTTNRFTDEEMCWMYSALDVSLSIAPEGFGYGSAESLACGVPTVAGSYAAQAEFVPIEMQVKPIAFNYEGAFCSKRPVFNPEDWADRVETLALMRNQTAAVSLLPEKVDWNGNTLWAAWQKWFEEGLNDTV